MIHNNQLPLVSCIMPTYNRRQFISQAITYFQRQDYENKELIIIDDGSDDISDMIPVAPEIRFIRLEKKITLGAKLNMACFEARGSIIVNWDDDDWYASWRLIYQVETLLEKKTNVCGINKLLYYDLRNKKAFKYIYPPDQRTWLLGSSLCYTKQLWNSNRFADIDVGMDGLFVWNTAPDNVTVLDDYSFSVHMIHNSNVSPKQTNGSWWHAHPVEEIQKLMGTDLHLYEPNSPSNYPKVNGHTKNKGEATNKPAPLKNVYACLVHENPDCIKDLVLNLHLNDPASVILLYNGSVNPELIPGDFPFDDFGAVIYPMPAPAKHGYLHGFALDSMKFALDNFNVDCLTIVDSDQLGIRAGYSEYVSKFITPGSSAGMLSSNADRVDRDNKENLVALQAFREYELWKPFISNFSNGEEKFVHWSFWPSTVFMADAARDLVQLFKDNEMLQGIMQRTKIWATEEVILPTLVRLLGYEIRNNPCSYGLVRYKIPVKSEEILSATNKSDTFWIHPVARNFDDPVRKLVRERFHQYENGNGKQPDTKVSSIDISQVSAIINKISKIEGWLSKGEAELLITATETVCKSLKPPHTLVEVGSYHGKSTMVIGSVIKEYFPGARIVSIDPHDGKLGAADKGLKTFPPSFEKFKRNLQEGGIEDIVEIVQETCQNIAWNTPVSFLLIDGLHDYMNVSRDFRRFSDWIRLGGYVAFHDYADYYPGVKVFVNELLEGGGYKKIDLVDSLIVLEKL